MPRDCRPSGRRSSSSKALRASLVPTRQAPALPARNRNCRRVTITCPPPSPRRSVCSWSCLAAALSIVLALALLGNRPVVLRGDVAVARHEALFGVGVHLQALLGRQVAPRVRIQVGGQIGRAGLVELGAPQTAVLAVLALFAPLKRLGLPLLV